MTPPNTELKSAEEVIELNAQLLNVAIAKINICDLPVGEHSDGELIKATLKKYLKQTYNNAMLHAAEIAKGTTFAAGGKRNDYEIAYDAACEDCEQAILTRAAEILKGEK